MKISELINKLNEIKDKYGDVPVVYDDSETCECGFDYEVEGVSVREYKEPLAYLKMKFDY